MGLGELEEVVVGWDGAEEVPGDCGAGEALGEFVGVEGHAGQLLRLHYLIF